MRYFGNRWAPIGALAVSDVVLTKVMTVVTPEAFDIPARTGLMRASFVSTDAAGACFLNFGSTKASIPTTAFVAASSEGSSATNVAVTREGRLWAVSTACTGFSAIAGSSGYLSVEFWNRSASTST